MEIGLDRKKSYEEVVVYIYGAATKSEEFSTNEMTTSAYILLAVGLCLGGGAEIDLNTGSEADDRVPFLKYDKFVLLMVQN